MFKFLKRCSTILMQKLITTTFLSIMFSFCGLSMVAASPFLYIHDSTANLGIVNVESGSTNIIGNMGVTMTDIGFDPSGNLFGLSFESLYSIDKTTGNTTFIGDHGIGGGNALVFGNDGTLYGAGYRTTSLFTIDVGTGESTSIGDMGFASAGDLTFNGDDLFLSSKTDKLVNIDIAEGAKGTAVGSFDSSGLSGVYALATGDDDKFYGVAGTQIFTVNTITGDITLISDYGGQGLYRAYGASAYTEAGGAVLVNPEPTTIVLLGIGLAGLAGAEVRRRRKKKAVDKT